MNARENIKRPFYPKLNARPVLGAVQLRLAAWIDRLVAAWLERRAANAVAAQRWFEGDRKPAQAFALGVRLEWP